MVPVRPERMYCGVLRTTFSEAGLAATTWNVLGAVTDLGALLHAQGIVADGRPGQVEGGEHLARVHEVDGRGVDGGAAEGQAGRGGRREVGAVDLDGDVAGVAARVGRDGGHGHGGGLRGGDREAGRGGRSGDAVGQDVVGSRREHLRHDRRLVRLIGGHGRLLVVVERGQGSLADVERHGPG